MSRPKHSMLVKILIFFLPLIYSYRFYNPYEFPKFIFFVIGVWLLGLIKALEIIKQKNKSSYSIQMDKLIVLIFIYLGIALISDLFGLDLRTSILGSLFRHQGFILLVSGVFLFILMRIKINGTMENTLKNYTQTILASSFFVSFFVLWQGWKYFVLNDLSVPTYNTRIVGTLGNPNSLGGYLSLVLPFILLADFKVFNKKLSFLNRVIKFLFFLFNLIAVFLSASRGAFLTIGVVLLIWSVYKIREAQRFSLRILGLVLSIIVLFSAVAVSVKNTSFFARNSIWDNRRLIYSQGLKAVIKRPFLGYGQENFGLIFPLKRKIIADNVHNLFLRILVSSGILGLATYLAFFIEGLRKASFRIKLFLIAFLIRSQFNPLSVAEIGLFWFVLSFVPPFFKSVDRSKS